MDNDRMESKPIEVADASCPCDEPLYQLAITREGESEDYTDVMVRMRAHIHGWDEAMAVWQGMGSAMAQLAGAIKAYRDRN